MVAFESLDDIAVTVYVVPVKQTIASSDVKFVEFEVSCAEIITKPFFHKPMLEVPKSAIDPVVPVIDINPPVVV
jgi:hypothetical protein